MIIRTSLYAAAGAALALLATAPAADLPLDQIELPPGFSISIYAGEVPGARSMALGDNGTLFVGTRSPKIAKKVYALRDTNGDGRADKTWIVDDGLHSPNGVAFRDGALYVAEISRILRYDDIEQNLENPPAPVVVIDTLPKEEMHGWKYLAFGPDGKLYFNIGAPCNDCNAAVDQDDPRFATIMRMDADGSNVEIYAHGVRNTVGFDWHPETGELYFTDNGRDMMGDDIPDCELNRVTEPGQHFGFPYFHAGDIPDPTHGAGKDPADYTAPILKLGPHVAPLGMKFYTGTQFPAEYKNRILIAQHGSWNRTIKIGYRVMQVALDPAGDARDYQDFATGWLQRQEAWGRPVDILVAPDGAVLVSDDGAGVIYRIAYSGEG